MKPAPLFKPWPLRPPPRYLHWMVGGLVVLALVGCAGVLLRPFMERWLPVIGFYAVALWLLAFLVRILFFRFNRHNAECYGDAARKVEARWWNRHRQRVALLDMVLIGPACSVPEHRADLFRSESRLPLPNDADGGKVLRSRQVMAKGQVAREGQLARLLAVQLREQRVEPFARPFLRCYWQGSPEAWNLFAEEMGRCFQVTLPQQPSPWQGLDSLDALIDVLQDADDDALVLCAGCESVAAGKEGEAPAGEAALLWLLGKTGGVRISRGEAFVADKDALPDVAERALRQCHLEAPTKTCTSFSPLPADLGWSPLQPAPIANFGELRQLEGMLALSLAAAHTQLNATPSAWLARDPSCTLALGVVTPDDSSC
ncbi:MAG: hypothetical protein LBJ37_05870 [Paucimonas sp.]|jgi:hypothetical protein|nr:hypothetical protein [Paucimonas sp.]